MIDRSVISKKHPDATTPTKEQVSTLKMKVLSSDSAERPIGHRISSVFKNIMHYCTYTSGAMKNQCSLYGHRLGSRIVGEQHFCADCGCKIKGPEDLRKAAPAAGRARENGDGSWR